MPLLAARVTKALGAGRISTIRVLRVGPRAAMEAGPENGEGLSSAGAKGAAMAWSVIAL